MFGWLRLWWRAIRPFAFPASIVPVVFGAALGYTFPVRPPGAQFHWMRFLAALFSAVCLHAGANLVNDLADFNAGLDRRGGLGSSGLLVEGAMQPAQVLRGAVLMFALATAVGLYLIHACGWFILGIGVFGIVSAVSYTAPPLALKYRALGDVQVGVTMGVAMVVGGHYVQALRLSWSPVFCSIPIALLVDAILHGNNLRDVAHDRAAGIRTAATLLKERRAGWLYFALVFGAYLAVPVLAAARQVPWAAMATWLSLPLAVGLARAVGRRETPSGLAFIDRRTAMLHLGFGLLYTASLFLES